MTSFSMESIALISFALLVLILLGAIGARLGGLQGRLAALTRIEAKLDLLLKEANVTFDPLADVTPAIAAALRNDRKIEAIRLYRQATGVGLKEAKEQVEAMQRRGGLG